MFSQCLELFWELRIANFVRIEIGYVDTDAVFYFALAEVVEAWSPAFVIFQILGHMM